MVIDNLLGFIFLAVFIEGFVEFFFAEPLKQWGTMTAGEFVKTFAPRYLALAVGIGVSFGFRVSVPSLFGLTAPAGLMFAVTGVVISRGSNYVHDIFGLLTKGAGLVDGLADRITATK